MSSLHIFDPELYYLGSLCCRGHDWNGTGKTLRNKRRGRCPKCDLVAEKERIDRLGDKYLGKLCRFGHDHEGTGKSLRTRSGSGCIECRRIRDLKPEYKERRKLHARKEREEKPELARQRVKEYRLRHRDRINQERREWNKLNRHVALAYEQRYRSKPLGLDNNCRKRARKRARKYNAEIVPYTYEQWQERKRYFDNLCAFCGSEESLARDHFVPLFHGGPDSIDNLILVCIKCNSSKHIRIDIEAWYKSKEFYDPARWQKILSVLGSDIIARSLI